jgi:hypothetical protein
MAGIMKPNCLTFALQQKTCVYIYIYINKVKFSLIKHQAMEYENGYRIL